MIKIGLVQFNNGFDNYLPYSIGLLQAFASKNLKNPSAFHFLIPLTQRVPLEVAVEHLKEASIVGFSCYVWNMQLNLALAQLLKLSNPEIIIVFGGPHVPDHSKQLLTQNPFIDLCCHGAGEIVFTEILNSFPHVYRHKTNNISYISKTGDYVKTSPSQRLKDLSLLPSPYLLDIFKPLMMATPEKVWLGLWETNRGCPFSCTFCDWGSATQSKVYSFDMDRLEKEMLWFADHRIPFVFVCDANFGILKRDIELAKMVCLVKEKFGFPQSMNFQNAKNVTERAYEIQKLLFNSQINKDVTLSLQSLHPATLKAVKRQNISTEFYNELQRRFTKDKIYTYTDMIIGLPGETYESFSKGVSTLINNGQFQHIEFHNLTVLPNSEIAQDDYRKAYKIVSVISQNTHIQNRQNIFEEQETVIATNTMPKKDWIKARIFAWTTSLLLFENGVLPIPLVITNNFFDISYKELIELFMNKNVKYNSLNTIYEYFLNKALHIQNGGTEYHILPGKNKFLRASKYIAVQLFQHDFRVQFYKEAKDLLKEWLINQNVIIPEHLLEDCFLLNKRVFEINSGIEIDQSNLYLKHNIMAYYQGIISGNPIELESYH